LMMLVTQYLSRTERWTDHWLRDSVCKGHTKAATDWAGSS